MLMRIFSNKRVIRELRIVSCPGGGVWVAVTREFERDNCVISEILQSDWTIPNRAGVPRKWTKVPRPSFHRYLTSRNGNGNGSRAPVGISTFGVETLLVGIFGAKVGANGNFVGKTSLVPRPQGG